MIQYLHHSVIDKKKWDETISASVNGIIYACSWFLDIVSPGWDALVSGDYESVLPLTHTKKWGIRYLRQPFFTQQLGIFSRTHLTASLSDEFLRNVTDRFRLAEIHLNAFNKVDEGRYRVIRRMNLELDLIPSYESLAGNYSQNTRRNLHKAFENNIELRRKVDPDELITLFRENFGKREGKLAFRDYETIRNLMNHCLANNLGMTLGAWLPGHGFSAGVFFLLDRTRKIFHFAASSPHGKEAGAMFLITDTFIREHAGQPVVLDFEGSDDPNVARFYKGFGAKEVPYLMLAHNMLPIPVKAALRVVKRKRE